MIDRTDPDTLFTVIWPALAVTGATLLAAASCSKRNQIRWPLPAVASALFAALTLLGIVVFDVEASRLADVMIWGALIVIPPAVAMAAWLRWGETRRAQILVLVGTLVVQFVPVALSTLLLACAHGGCK